MAKKVLLKDLLFNRAKISRLAREIKRVHRSFQDDKFVRDVVSKFPELELKARISWIADCLKYYLPRDYNRAIAIIIKSLPAANNPKLSDNDFGDFIYAPYAEFVAKNGCSKNFLRTSLDALHKLTQRFSAEDAIRYFINAFPQETLRTLQMWSRDSHYHVRRLCSEGTRPKLPWSQKINIPPPAALPLLNSLYSDKTRYVTRSVANHLNDISKIDPELVIDTLTQWRKSQRQNAEEMEYIIRHSLRTLVKQGNPKAMRILGFDHSAHVRISKLRLAKIVKMNSALEFSFSIQAAADLNVLIDYTIYFQNKAGTLSSKKIYKLTKLRLSKGKSVTISKRHLLRERMTTRTLYPGKHQVEIQVNGKRYAKTSFMLR